jgi:hypothetical protein
VSDDEFTTDTVVQEEAGVGRPRVMIRRRWKPDYSASSDGRRFLGAQVIVAGYRVGREYRTEEGAVRRAAQQIEEHRTQRRGHFGGPPA